MSFESVLALVLLLTGHAAAFWRMPCRYQTGLGRLDPIMDPGEISAHVHTITGGGGFGFDATFETLTANGTCSACDVAQDHSAYWTPALYFVHDNGTTVLVEEVGGMLAYYLPLLPNVTAFPEGFQMIAGDQYLRNFSGPVPDTPLSFWPTYPADQYFLQQRALGFNCLNYDLGVTPEPSLYRHTMPSKDYLDAHCKDGLRLELAFPSCGNGSLDSTDRTSHVQYPSLVKEGNCPDGFDVHYPFLFFETIWATNAFAGQDGQFVLSYGDPVGTGYHGDFIMRWESADFLQQALDTCTNPSGMIQDCPLFDIQDDAVVQQCTFLMPESLMEDDCHGPRKGLPVDVPIQYGPEEATTYPIADRRGSPTTTIENTAAPATFADLSTFAYSPANPTSTKTALGGIVVAIESLQTIITTTIVALSQQQQQPPATTTGDSAVTTATKLVDGEVSEIVMLEVDITTTVTTTTTTFVSSSASAAASKKRHLDHHRNHVHHVRR